MGRGNCCVFGSHEGLYFIDNDDFHVYRRIDASSEDCPESRLVRNLDYGELTGGMWIYDELATELEETDIVKCFTEDFLRMFPSFNRVCPERWISSSQRAILESRLFYICLEDNVWSLAVELIQKEAPWGANYDALQARHCQRYLKGMEKCLLNRLPSIGLYKGAWTSGTLRREDLSA